MADDRVNLWTVSAIVNISYKKKEVNIKVEEWSMIRELYEQCEINKEISCSVSWNTIASIATLTWTQTTTDIDKVPSIIKAVRSEASWDLGCMKTDVENSEAVWTKMRPSLESDDKKY